ncbi:carboxypeptidase [Sphingobium xenophagum]|uniref:Carboxypeptidase n=2 Tax=Sphingobium xenophagum TaxID=121428 RepID=A0A249MY81_SPHXE|nr:M14 family metallopeptidase [Sphingobium xenophagum]ASY46175.1 carboxypeptidase [Sphingobium xenophagum]QWT16132.1 M14 family metallopeptidase [Sphingobium xenophagum]
MRRLLSLVLFMAAHPALAQSLEAPLPPLAPWKGASEKLIVGANDPWITPAERVNFVDTPDYAATRAWLERLVASAPQLLSIESFGKTAQGRDLYFVRASKGGGGKPVLLVQAGIHSGEIDGKDAGMMLLRDIAHRGKHGLLDKVDLVFVPIFNADGHERASPWNRPNQRGPRSMGWRTTAQNLNLNRDYLKADAPEMQAMIALINRLDPTLYLDLHVTDGIDHQYDVAYAFSGWRGYYAKSPAIGRWLDTRLRPAMDAALKRAGHTPGYYVSAVDNRNPDKGISHDPDTPRYSTGYGDYRHVPTILIETLSLRPYRQRVLGTYVFVEEALRLAGNEGARLRAAIDADRAERPADLVVKWKPLKDPIYTVDFLGIAHDRYRSAASGREEIRWLGRPITQKIPVFGEEPDQSVRLPKAWWVPATAPEVIERLKLHGIRFETIDAPRTIELDMVRIAEPKLGAPIEGRVPLMAGGFTHGRRSETFPAGSVRVPSDQPLGLLAAALLEPESADGVLAWNFFPGMLQRTEYIEAYAIAPLAERMLTQNAALRQEFETKLAADPAFAADGNARLAWFYERTPYFDDRYLLYPIGRE